MKAFVVSLSEFFSLSRNNTDLENFDQDVKQYVIPKYQREYKWADEKVLGLIQDINNKDKFLGNVILDKKESSYEIVDGQQRITTIFLILVALFNKLMAENEDVPNHEQLHILEYIKNDNLYILKNDTIGDFIIEEKNKITLLINPDKDIYFQNEIFTKLNNLIIDSIQNIADINSFINKMLDCKLLVLINNNSGHSDSIEQVYLDINFKSQHLDVADIFKGYCFKNYRNQYHETLKDQWVKLISCSVGFKKFGYDDLSNFLYYYLLSKQERQSISDKLLIRGIHYLEGKNNNETYSLLKEMIEYGENVLFFRNNLNDISYKFNDICPDSSNYNNTFDYKILKEMCIAILDTRAAQYHKFPLMMLIHYLVKEQPLREHLKYTELKKMLTNYYIYSFLFLGSPSKKSKKSIDPTIFNVLYSDNENIIPKLVDCIKDLRRNGVTTYEIPNKFNKEHAYALYSIIDFYNARENFLPQMYSFEAGFNVEHLIIPDNRKKLVKWCADNNTFDIDLNCIKEFNSYKNSFANCMIMEKGLNAELGRDDIVEKISKIEDKLSDCMPIHFELFINRIKQMSSYQALCDAKRNFTNKEEIHIKYIHFIDEYFSQDNQKDFKAHLNLNFSNTFQNQQ